MALSLDGSVGNLMSDRILLYPINEDGSVQADMKLPKSAQEICESMVPVYRGQGFVKPWIGYLAVQNGNIVGTCAFKAPLRAGKVEIACFTFPEYEGRGIGTEMVRRLVAITRDVAPDAVIAAQTTTEESPSTKILVKLQFRKLAEVAQTDDGPVWEWELVA